MGGELYSQLMSRLRDGKNTVLLTRFQGGQGSKNQAMAKRLADGEEADGAALEALTKGLPVVSERQGETVVAEPFYPEERMLVLGGGHIALPLVRFAAEIGFSVTVVDDRPDFANSARFPSAGRVKCDSFGNAITDFRITRSDYVIIITRGHRHDQVCLETLLKGPEPFYTGMIGSRRRVAAVKDLLVQQGCDAERLSRVHTPIGLPIGAVTPEEISVSIVAEVIACKRLKSAGEERPSNRSDVDFGVLSALAGEKAGPASVVTVIAAKGSVPRGAGAKMLVFPDGRIAGSIGGGCSEAAVIGNARGIIGTGKYLVQTVELTADAAENEGMVCGGVMQVLIEDL